MKATKKWQNNKRSDYNMILQDVLGTNEFIQGKTVELDVDLCVINDNEAGKVEEV